MNVPMITDLRDGRILGTYRDYAAAQRTVELLSDRGFPVAGVRIVGNDVRIVEQVTGRMTTWRAAGAGAASGMWFGALIGLIFGIATPYFFAPLLWGLIFGALFGAIFGGIAHAALRGQRDFASVRGFTAAGYDVIVPEDGYPRAWHLLSAAGGMPPQREYGPAGGYSPAMGTGTPSEG
jgi:hypothetical protein